MKTFLSKNTKINFFEINETAENTILFIHGNSSRLQSFSNQMSAPELKNYRLIFVDLPGHGESSKNGNYSLKNIAEVLGELLNALEIKKFIVAGHSLGGHVAINLLNLTTISRPQGLFLFGTPPLQNPLDPNAFIPNANAGALGMVEPTLLEVENLMLEMGLRGELMHLAIEAFQTTDGVFRQEILADVFKSLHVNEVDSIGFFEGEVMFLLASNDTLINNNYIQTVFSNMDSTVRFETIESGHCPHSEKSSKFNKLLLDFSELVFYKNTDTNITTKRPIQENQTL